MSQTAPYLCVLSYHYNPLLHKYNTHWVFIVWLCYIGGRMGDDGCMESQLSTVWLTIKGIPTQYRWQRQGGLSHEIQTHMGHRHFSRAITSWPNKKGSRSTRGQADITNWNKGTTEATGIGLWVRDCAEKNQYTQERRWKIRGIHLLHDEMWGPMMSMKIAVPLLSGRVVWLALNAIGSQADSS